MGLLGEILEVFNICLDESGDCNAVLEILMELSKSSRFRLALSFLGKDEKRAVGLCWLSVLCDTYGNYSYRLKSCYRNWTH